MQTRISGPCMGCEEREVGCHSKCEKYAEYQQKLDDYKNVVYKERNKEALFTGVSIGKRRTRSR